MASPNGQLELESERLFAEAFIAQSRFTVKESLVITISGRQTPFLTANPRRIGFLAQNGQGLTTVQLSTSPVNQTNQGLFIQDGRILEIFYSRHGILPSLAWYIFTIAAGNTTVIEILTVR